MKLYLQFEPEKSWELPGTTCEPPPSCHRFPTGILELTDLLSAPKVMSLRRDEVIEETSGDGLRIRGVRGVVPGGVVTVTVEWDEDGSNVRAGPNAKHYEACRRECGAAHFMFNAFLAVQHFCAHQMLPRDRMPA